MSINRFTIRGVLHMMYLRGVVTFLFLATGSVFPQTTSWKVDQTHSNVTFTVSHMVIAQVSGRFKEFDVAMTHTNDDLADARILATIRTASIDTDNDRRDTHLRSDDFFNVEQYPDMTFKSTSIEKVGKDAFRITGNLTIRDITKPVVLETKYFGTIQDPYGNTRSGFRATTTISRFEFGTKWNAAIKAGGFVVGENVDVTLQMQFIKQKETDGAGDGR